MLRLPIPTQHDRTPVASTAGETSRSPSGSGDGEDTEKWEERDDDEDARLSDVRGISGGASHEPSA